MINLPKIIFFSIYLSLISNISAGILSIPTQYQHPNPESISDGSISRIGYQKNNQGEFFAVKIKNLEKQKKSPLYLSIYWNSDNNLLTGRFPQKGGYDRQFNINLKKQSVQLITWKNNKDKETIKVPAGKIQFRQHKNLVFLALADNLIPDSGAASNSIARFTTTTSQSRLCSVHAKLKNHSASQSSAFSFDFSGFSSSSWLSSRPPSGKGIALPVVWHKKTPSSTSGTINAVGFHQDSEKLIWGLQGKNLAPQGSLLSFYWDSDDNLQTGRFPGVSGTDIQLNINLSTRKMSALFWKSNTSKIRMTLYNDDYLIAHQGSTIFITLRRKMLQNFQLQKHCTLRINYQPPNLPAFQKQMSFSLPPSTPLYLPDKFDFNHLNSLRSLRTKPRIAQPLSQCSPLTIWSCGGERFSLGESRPSFSPPVSEYSLHAAAGESEHLFLVLETETPASQLRISPIPLTSRSGHSIRPNVQQIRFADFICNNRGETYTDILLPHPIPNRRKQYVVYSCHVPRKTPSGTYHGQIPVIIQEKAIAYIPLKLEVYPFSLPLQPACQTMFTLKASHIRAKYSVSQLPGIYSQMRSQAARFRYNPRIAYDADMRNSLPEMKLSGNKLNIKWEKYDRSLELYFKDFHLTQFIPAQLGSHNQFYRINQMLNTNFKTADSPMFQNVWEQIVREYYQHYSRKTYWEKILFIIWDEPYSPRWGDIILTAETVRKNIPDLPIAIWIDQYEPQLDSHIDIWLLPLPGAGDMLRNPALQNKKIGIYNSGDMQNFKVPAGDIRGYFWLQPSYNLFALLSSEINHITLCRYSNGQFRNDDPLHCWMYVSPDGKTVYDSWRQLLVGDGIDDCDYIFLYRKLLKKHNLKEPEWLSGKMPSFAQDNSILFKINTIEQYNNLKKQIAKEIIRLQSL